MALEIGDKIQEFIIKDDQGENFNSKDLIGKKAFVLYFYPKNFTPGCTKEACSFRDSYQDFLDLGVEVIGVSSDSVASHQKFKEKYGLPFKFLADINGDLRKQFGVKSNLLGLLPGRETYVIDKKGIIRLKFNSINAAKHKKIALSIIKEITYE